MEKQLEVGKIWIGQPSYAQNVLEKSGLENCKPAASPVDTGTKLLKATENSELFDTILYQSAVGMLLYLSGWTRPDIMFTVSNVAKSCSMPTKKHWVAVERILRHLKGTINYGLMYSKTDKTIIGYSDAEWAGDENLPQATCLW